MSQLFCQIFRFVFYIKNIYSRHEEPKRDRNVWPDYKVRVARKYGMVWHVIADRKVRTGDKKVLAFVHV